MSKNLLKVYKCQCKDCCNGAIVFNNNLEGAEQDEPVRQQLKLVLINIKENGGEFYTNEMYTEAEKKIRKEEGEKLLFEKETFEENPNFLKKNMTNNQLMDLNQKQDRDIREIGSLEKKK